MQIIDKTKKKQLKDRLARLEGQLRGIQQMVEDERDCVEIVQQFSAVSSGIHSAKQSLLTCAVDTCLVQPGLSESARQVQIKELIDLVTRVA